MDMPIIYRTADPADRSAIALLLSRSSLPSAITEVMLNSFIVACADGRVVGAVGLEQYAQYGLLRSFVVDHAYRGQGVGRELFRRVLDLAAGSAVSEVYVLTTTIEDLCVLWGFRRVRRDVVPAQVAASDEFRSVCPSSAICMVRAL